MFLLLPRSPSVAAHPLCEIARLPDLRVRSCYGSVEQVQCKDVSEICSLIAALLQEEVDLWSGPWLGQPKDGREPVFAGNRLCSENLIGQGGCGRTVWGGTVHAPRVPIGEAKQPRGERHLYDGWPGTERGPLNWGCQRVPWDVRYDGVQCVQWLCHSTRS